jgi:steroid 5-alpha reductase family enzyme
MLVAAFITLGYFTIFFIVGTLIKNNSIVDIGWGLGFVLVSWALFFISGEYTVVKVIANTLVSLWGLRLFYYILKRNVFQEEDFRYKNWRKTWGKWVIPRAFLQVFMLQGLLQFLIGSAVYYINVNSPDFSVISIIGIVIWVFGYYFEVFGDKQLKNHIQSKKGGLIDYGLWSFTRHPNYFGEAFMWWGIFVFAILNGAPLFYVISPLVITVVLRFISTPLLEKKMKGYDGWDTYANRTPLLVPIIGKKGNL